MTLIRSHSCTKCGGALIVHNDRQQYECPYCSIFYDYEYFRSRIVLEQAETSQKMLQYDSAKEKYDFILQKDPHNFLALRGNLLCEAKINRAEELRRPEIAMKLSPLSMAQAEEAAEADDKEYFHRLRLLREIGGFLRQAEKDKRMIETGYMWQYSKLNSAPRTQEERTEAIERKTEQIRRFKDRFSDLYSQLLQLEPEEIRQETLRNNSGKGVKHDEGKQFGLKASLSCTSCGGELVVNLNRQVYECPFCGLSFDFDIVRDEIAHSEAR